MDSLSLEALQLLAEGGDASAVSEVCKRARALQKEVVVLKEDKIRLENYIKTLRYVKRACILTVERQACFASSCSASHRKSPYSF
jgi:hypothetical protein